MIWDRALNMLMQYPLKRFSSIVSKMKTSCSDNDVTCICDIILYSCHRHVMSGPLPSGIAIVLNCIHVNNALHAVLWFTNVIPKMQQVAFSIN